MSFRLIFRKDVENELLAKCGLVLQIEYDSHMRIVFSYKYHVMLQRYKIFVIVVPLANKLLFNRMRKRLHVVKGLLCCIIA